ncbi:MAG: LysM peptidoglycan-binding domain-containing protein [Ignavibacteriales bacterium]|nr:LysM peptidoglycan-binding domain-containing protein [Ignavibacteriales bacterium]
MKKLTYLVCSLVLFLSALSFAQEKMTKEEWQNEISRLTDQKTTLTTERDAVEGEVSKLKEVKVQTIEDCYDELYALIGTTKADVDNFRKLVADLNGKIMRKEAPKADRQTELDALKKNRISALPEFFDKVQNQMQRSLDAWVEAPKEVMYTVVKGDCLWNIAKKKEHYGNAFAWPKIYQANRDQIKNPDLIYPKQIFKIPNLTEEEKAKYDKLRANYKPAPVSTTPAADTKPEVKK